ncbi:hypothetical protein [Noviherbaspirillum sp.]|uniref:hypothetical protein n=1 Tax=Noviherbaspirillum sp. TaxID=1926288 RepID=UPI002D393513|nr:hypothetical protein [Noviherbaspirillum sp.]HZW21721.1 hypothetical protein [Noviherbaspirillum sp.]
MIRLPNGRAILRALSCAGATTLLLASCGGGGGDSAAEDAFMKTTNINANANAQISASNAGSQTEENYITAPEPQAQEMTDTVESEPTANYAPTGSNQNGTTATTTPTTTTGTTTTTPTTAPTTTTTTSPTAGAITNLKIQNTAASEQRNVPFTVGQVFAKGALLPADGLAGRMSNGTSINLQVDVKATHPDGSVRHAIISGVVPALAASEVRGMDLVKAAAGSKTGAAPTTLTNAGFTAGVSVNLGGIVYTASADALLKAGGYKTWITGPLVNEWQVSAPLKNSAGTPHPHLTARFAVRSYTGLNKARVDVTVENNWAYEPKPQNFTYDATVTVGGQTVFSQPALKHFHHARWRKVFWWGGAPQAEVQHNGKYIIATGAMPNYDTTVTVSSTALAGLDSRWLKSNIAPMGSGVVLPGMPTTGGRPDIGPLPEWSAMYLLSMDNRAKKVTLGVGDLAGSWPIHYRDKKTDMPVSLDNYPYMTLLGAASDAINPVTKLSELFPACGGDCATIYQPDSSHQPSMSYLPYVTTGDYYYLEELQFWANYNMLKDNPRYREFAKGIVKSDQVRGQAWSLRTLGHAAYITPDSHPMKKYFVDRVGYNIDWYTATYVTGNPNNLGVIDGSGTLAFKPMAYTTPAGAKTGLAPWMDDFFTWSVGHLVELGFTNAKPLLTWKAKFPIQRLTGAGYCWIDGATYALAVRPTETSPLYATIGEAYRSTMRNASGGALTNSTGAAYLNQQCASQAMADWRTQYDRDRGVNRVAWKAGEMDGYATVPSGYPSNMQPALAVAATSGQANARAAWDLFMRRPVKPDYSTAPQWNVVPRF